MASTPFPSAIVNPLLGHALSEKLNKTNHALWRAQVLAVVRGARLEGFLTGATPAPPAEIVTKDDNGKEVKMPNPAIEDWITKDQQVLGYLLTSMTKDVLAQVAALGSSAAVWSAVEGMFASATRARSVNTRIALATTKKGNMSITEYITKMRSLGDEMAHSGKPIDDEELISYILTGLDYDFNPIVSALVTRVEPISVAELYSQLLSFESRMELLHGEAPSSANAASRGGRGGVQRGRGRNSGGRGYSRGRGRVTGGSGQRQGNGNFNRAVPSSNSMDNRPKCQLCNRRGHTVIDCWYRFDENFVPDEKYAGAVTNSYGVDTNWYMDTGATDHITGELEKMSVREKYNGSDQIHTANGAGPSHQEHSA